MQTPAPTEIRYDKAQRILRLTWSDGETHELSAECLRVCAPSADVRHHGPTGPEQWSVVPDKENVAIEAIDPVGNYAVRLRFSDGHDTGLYSWDVLRDLIDQRDHYWSVYTRRRDQILQARAVADRARQQSRE